MTAFRWCDYDVPFWARPNTRDGRWHAAGTAVTQYWALTPEAAWAELIRHENLRTEEELDQVRMPLWACRASSAMIVDLRLTAEQERYAIGPDELLDEDWRRCQAVGAEVRRTYSGLISPCAALPAHANLTLFGERRAIAWTSEPALTSTLPAVLLAIGRPPGGLLEQTRRPEATEFGRLFDS